MRFFCFIFLIFSFNSFHLSAQICSGSGATAQTAQAVCATQNFPQQFIPPCTGVVLPPITGNSCPAGENLIPTNNSAWYRIHVFQSGTLGFTIAPFSAGADYDWVLFNVTNQAPQNVYTTNLVVGYNQSSTTGPTGCAASGTVDYNCFGATPRFNRLLPVVTGEDYLLMVKKFSGTGQEYNLDFTGGTALLTNNAAPTVLNAAMVGCNPSQIKVNFSEDILCSSITTPFSPSTTEFVISNGTNVITGITSSCNAGSNSFNTLTLSLQNPLSPGTYMLTVNSGGDGNTLLDVCGDAMTSGVQVPFTIPPQTVPTITQVTKANCIATILKVAFSQLLQCSTISANGSEFTITPGSSIISSVTTNCSGTSLSTDTIYINLQNPLVDGLYTLSIKNGTDGNTFVDNCNIAISGGTNKAFAIATTPAAPSVTSPIDYCQNQISPALTAGGSNLLWYANGTGGTASSNAPIPSTASIGSTIYYVSQSAGTCESPRSSITVNIATSPTPPPVIPQVNYCVGTTATALSASGTNIRWYTTATGGTASTIAPIPSTVTAGTTLYFVSRYVGSCESPRAEIMVVVTATPAAPMVGSTVNYCQGDTAMNLIVSGTNLLWYANATGGAGNAVAPVVSTVNIGTNTYYLSQLSAGCEGPRSSITVNINATPAAPTVPPTQTYCQNAPTSPLIVSGNNLKWYTQATGGSASTTIPIISSATAGTTIYYVSQTTGNCESPRSSIQINITATPTVPAVSNIINFCPNQTVGPLSDSVTGTNLLWYTNATGGTGTLTSPTVSTNIFPATYTFYVSQSNATASGSCEGPRAQITVNVDNFLNVNIGNDTTICEGETVKFFPTVTPANALYQWRSLNEPNNTIDNILILNASVKPLNNSNYVLGANIGGCIKEDTIRIIVRTKPVVNAGMPVAICLNDSTLLSATISRVTAPGFVTTYFWTPAVGIRNDSLLQTFAYPTKTTLYSINAITTLADYGCDFVSTETVNVIVQPIVFANAGRDTIAVKGSQHQLQGSGGLFYEWSSPTATLSNPFTKKPFTVLTNDAVFYLKVVDAIGCVGRDTVFVKVLNGPTYYLPNAFTPNGDGQNDIFRAIPAGFANTTYFRIFNRNGLLLFETNQYLKGWDGTFNGKPQPAGVYVWTVAGMNKDFKRVEVKGTVNLLR